MKTHAARLGLCLLAAAIAQALVAVPVAALAAPQDAGNAGAAKDKASAEKQKPVKLETIEVTAQRRSQNLQKVPITVTAITQEELERRGINNVNDLDSVAPNLEIHQTGTNVSTVAVSIRGMVQNNPSLYADSPVGMYIDGVYAGKTIGTMMMTLLNLKRIEVLNGPQGTLFGRNTLAGAINLVTNEPSGEFLGTAQLDIGNYGSKVAKVVVDLPAMGKLKATVGGRIERGDGWVKTTPGTPNPSLNNQHNQEGFLSLHYDFSDNFGVDYHFDRTSLNQFPPYEQAIYSNVDSIFRIPGIVPNTQRQTTASINVPTFERVRNSGQSLTATWKVDDVNTLKFIGGYRHLYFHRLLDLDGSPIDFAETAQVTHYHSTSYELQELGATDRWNWVVGLYDYHDSGVAHAPQSFFFHLVNYGPNIQAPATHSRAVYGQASYKLTDRLTLTAGWRRTLEEKSISREMVMNGNVVRVPAGTHASQEFSANTPDLSLSYQFDPNHMVYARYAKGFQSGGYSGDAQSVADVTTPFRPETQKSFELGTKNLFLRDTFRVNADVFFNRITDLQAVEFTAKGSASTAVLNVGKAHSYGFELQAQWRPIENFTLSVNYGLLRFKYDKFVVLGVDDAGNRAVIDAPRNTLSVVMDSVLARTSRGVLRGSLDYRFTDSFYLNPYQIVEVDPTKQVAANSRVPSRGLLNARLSFGQMDWGHGLTGEVALWVRNLTDVDSLTHTIDFGRSFGNLRIATFQPPRMFGASLIARW